MRDADRRAVGISVRGREIRKHPMPLKGLIKVKKKTHCRRSAFFLTLGVDTQSFHSLDVVPRKVRCYIKTSFGAFPEPHQLAVDIAPF